MKCKFCDDFNYDSFGNDTKYIIHLLENHVELNKKTQASMHFLPSAMAGRKNEK